MSKKMSYVVALEKVLAGEAIEGEVRERLEALKAAQEKKSARKGTEGPTKAQIERQALAEQVLSLMEPEVEYGTAEIGSLVPELAGATPQKISPLMKLLGEQIVTAKVKGKLVYKLA